MNSLRQLFSFTIIFIPTCMQASQVQIDPQQNRVMPVLFCWFEKLQFDLERMKIEEEGKLSIMPKNYALERLNQISNINAQDDKGNTLLHLAAFIPNYTCLIKLVDFLLNNSPELNLNIQNNKEQTAIELAIQSFANYYCTERQEIFENASKDIIEQLASHGAILDTKKWGPVTASTAVKKALKIYRARRVIAEQREKEQDAYEMEIANNLQGHIPIKDLSAIVCEYTKMSLLEFIHFQKIKRDVKE